MSIEKPRVTKDNHRRDFIRESLLLAAVPAGLIGSAAQAVANSRATRPSVVRLGLIGCGYRGVRLAQAAMTNPNVQLHAVADLRPDRIQQLYRALNGQFSSQLQLDAGSRFLGVKAAQQLATFDLDAVIVATPPVYKPEILGQLLQSRKHIYVEAPLAVDFSGCQQLQQLSDKSNDNSLTVQVGQLGRPPESWPPLIELLQHGAIGELIFAEATVCSSSSTISNQPNRTANLGRSVRGNDLRINKQPETKFNGYLEPLVETFELLSWLGDFHPLRATTSVLDHAQAVIEFPLTSGLNLRCNLLKNRPGQSPLPSLRIQGSTGWCDLTKGQLYGPTNQLLAAVPPLSRRLNESIESWMQQIAETTAAHPITERNTDSPAADILTKSIKSHLAAFFGLNSLTQSLKSQC